MWHSYANEHANMMCENTNNICYGGRKIYEWHDNATLWIYPENRFDTIVTVEPIGFTNTQAVYVQDAYYVTPVVQAYSPANASSMPPSPSAPVVVIQNTTLTPLHIQNNQPPPPYHPHNNSYQPPTTDNTSPSSTNTNGPDNI